MLALGIKIGLGTDGAKRSDLDMFYQMRLLKAALTGYYGVPVGEAPGPYRLKMPSACRPLGKSAAWVWGREVGTLETGKKANVVLLGWPASRTSIPSQRSFPMIFSVANARDAPDVIIDGQLIVKNRVHRLLDAEEVMAKAGERLSSILARE